MKETNINEVEVTLYNFLLLKQKSKLLNAIRNETKRKKFTERTQEYRKIFPIYFEEIKTKFKEAMNMVE
ncbi:MAG: hypothetical protein ABI045_01810 [Flavobacteriales bacterium]